MSSLKKRRCACEFLLSHQLSRIFWPTELPSKAGTSCSNPHMPSGSPMRTSSRQSPQIPQHPSLVNATPFQWMGSAVDLHRDLVWQVVSFERSMLRMTTYSQPSISIFKYSGGLLIPASFNKLGQVMKSFTFLYLLWHMRSLYRAIECVNSALGLCECVPRCPTGCCFLLR